MEVQWSRQPRTPPDVWLGPCDLEEDVAEHVENSLAAPFQGRCGYRSRTTSRRPRMTLQRMDHVGIVVDNLAGAKAFFVELGLEREGETPVEGRWVDRVTGLEGVRADIALMRTPDGHGKVEPAKFHTPPARADDPGAPANALGIRHLLFAVKGIDEVLDRLRAHGAELVGEVEQYENRYRLCYIRGPEEIIVELAEEIG
jgi:catechol 2,3-dioxygenase-like lactoylglutathione lyase family enzyme